MGMHIWVVPSERNEDVHNIMEKSKKSSNVVRRMNALVKKHGGKIYSSIDEVPEKYLEDGKWAVLNLEIKED